METAGYLSSILIGISLGLIGGGGSILTVPILVYLFHIDAVLATVYSLFIVGTTSVVGSLAYLKRGLVNIKTAIFFGIPSIASVFITRAYIVPAIPEVIFSTGDFTIVKNSMVMVLFAILMVVASYSMIRTNSGAIREKQETAFLDYAKILSHGVLVGFITGMVGAGGGFLIIPVLVNVFRMPIKKAVGSSLVIIALNSLLGFLSSLSEIAIYWDILINITLIAIVGFFIGAYISTKIKSENLKPAFGWFVLIMGIYIIIKETWLQ